jgi:hypothetical protein
MSQLLTATGFFLLYVLVAETIEAWKNHKLKAETRELLAEPIEEAVEHSDFFKRSEPLS